MIVKEYLEEISKTDKYNNVTFIIVKAVEDENTPFYHDEYVTTPIRATYEWLNCNGSILDLLVINKDHSPIDITGNWCNMYKRGHLKCCVVAHKDYLKTMYSEKQAKEMEEYYKKIVKNL